MLCYAMMTLLEKSSVNILIVQVFFWLANMYLFNDIMIRERFAGEVTFRGVRGLILNITSKLILYI